MDEETLERLAELEHVQWCEWAEVMSDELSFLVEIIDKYDIDLTDEEIEFVDHVKERLSRWEKLLIPYSDLPEEEKEKDRVYARKNASVFKGIVID
jgi:hypothetical protein